MAYFSKLHKHKYIFYLRSKKIGKLFVMRKSAISKVLFVIHENWILQKFVTWRNINMITINIFSVGLVFCDNIEKLEYMKIYFSYKI